MRSKVPKVLHRLAGRPLIDYALDLCGAVGVARPVVVLSPHHPEVAAHVEGRADVVWQREQLGTGHALRQVPAERLRGRSVLVLYGDMPLLTRDTAESVRAAQAGSAAAIASAPAVARGFARVIRGEDGTLKRIVEERDATPEELQVSEANVGFYCFDGEALLRALPKLTTQNAAGEYYLTEIFSWLRPTQLVEVPAAEAAGVNDRAQLAAAEHAVQARLRQRLMLSGVTFTAPETCIIEAGVEVGQDTVIEPYTILRGETRIGADCQIGPHADIADSVVGDGCVVRHSWLRECRLGAGSDCGPYSKLRPGTELAERVHVGSFAEIVRTRIGAETKVPHFSYVGDAVIGERVNIAAGTITANYDGEKKNGTVIEDDVFVGVDTMLRAPVRLGRASRTGAGSVVTKDVPDGALAVGMPARVVKRRPAAATEEEGK
jgi:bifunctional UDP-N-acetylglucosamine pyrophosphorylase/glucosamine-1-phosphate N-acetyltransferase